jgi:hypothetical protein
MEVFVTHLPDLHVRSAAAAENSEVIPEVLHTFFRDDERVPGHLVVDSTVKGLCAGGIRMVPEMPLADLCHLARPMSLKHSFLKWPFGGAKAAILTHRANRLEARRTACLRLFALGGEDANRDISSVAPIQHALSSVRPKRGSPASESYVRRQNWIR